MSIVVILLFVAFVFLFSAALAVLVVGPLVLLQPERRSSDWYREFTDLLEPQDAGLPQENILLITPDGIPLHGWLVAQPRRPRGSILYLHGVGDCKTSGVPLAKLLFNHGYSVFLYDSRRHGVSGGAYCTYGYYEKFDVSTVISYLESRRELTVGPLGVFGTSMGAAVAIQAAALDDRIRAVVAEASFTDLRTIAVDYQRRLIKLPWHFLRNVALTRAQIYARFKAREVSPLHDIRTLTIPVLLIHGIEDRFIRYQYSKQLYDNANEPKDLLLVPGAHHTNVWDVAGKEFEEKVLKFFDSALRADHGRRHPSRRTRKGSRS